MARRLAIALLVACAAASVSLAGPFYVGASYGNAALEVDTSGFKFDENDSAWKAFAGYRFLKFFGVEGSYVDLGSPSDGTTTVSSTGWSAFAVGVLPLGPVGLFAKLGTIASDSDITGGLGTSSTDPAYGVGAEFSISKIAIRAEYEMFDVKDTKSLYLASIGVAWQF